MKVSAIIQARMASVRLPRKVLLDIMGKPVLEYVVERTRKADSVEKVVVATTLREEDAAIVELAGRMDVLSYRGSEDDVLDRFYQSAKLFNIKHIARITADCPLIDPELIDSVIDHYFKSKADYCSNALEETFPDGEDIEIFSFKALEAAWREAKLLSEREHVTPFIKKHPEIFRIESYKSEKDLSGKRWTLDRKEDLEFIKKIIESLYAKNPYFGIKDILRFLKENPAIEDINKGIERNEGYIRSLKEDRPIR